MESNVDWTDFIATSISFMLGFLMARYVLYRNFGKLTQEIKREFERAEDERVKEWEKFLKDNMTKYLDMKQAVAKLQDYKDLFDDFYIQTIAQDGKLTPKYMDRFRTRLLELHKRDNPE